MDPDFDLFIVGAGQAGPSLARSLAAKGRRVAIAERKDVGGSCVNFGCTPTKAAFASTRLAHLARRGAQYGLRIPAVEVDYAAVIGRARDVAVQFRDDLVSGLESAPNVSLVRGHARFQGRDGDRFRLRIGTRSVSARQVVLDTGTRSVIPPIEGLEAAGYVHAGNWLDLAQLPARLVIIGGGAIGLEMAQFYRRLGSEVAVTEGGGQVAGHEDADVASALQQSLEAEGIRFLLETRVEKVQGQAGNLRVVAGGTRLEATHVFVATGRQANTDDLGLETVGVKVSKHGIVEVDERLATSVAGIWAVGDIRGGPMFTHTAWDDFRIVESQIAGDGSRTTDRVVPYAVFTDPELGRVGMTEAEARKAGRRVKIGRFEMKGNGKAREIGETAGFIKVVVDAEDDRLLGAAVLASEGAELVHAYVTLMNARAPIAAIRDAVFIHPTLAEAVQSAVSDPSS
jgi:pyruvate/2-oxoglutarate dehydrogenase complex dihydrolipoamide dehydrogenase (E3) component